MKKVSVVYHSGYGHTGNQAKGIISGIESVEHAAAALIAIGQNGGITDVQTDHC
jgi:NAD(P)H dehydrogenase (quinone)